MQITRDASKSTKSNKLKVERWTKIYQENAGKKKKKLYGNANLI